MIPHMEGRRPPPTPSPPGQEKLSPEEIQRRLDEHFGHLPNCGRLPEPQAQSPEPKRSPEELQRALDAAFGGMASRPPPSPSPRRLRSMLRSLRSRSAKPASGGPSRRRRCDARVKNLFKICKNGVRVSRGLFCKAWAMENGRCRVHGGLSTGPRSPDGKARVVAAMVEGRRKWVALRRAAGKKFPAGRKRGERWATEPMRERARAEAHRLKGGRFTLDHSLTLALLRSANGCLESGARAKAMLDAQERAAMERDLQAALALNRELRASLLGGPKISALG
jgi:hypothetical protein